MACAEDFSGRVVVRIAGTPPIDGADGWSGLTAGGVI
jgi:hypothetical protein